MIDFSALVLGPAMDAFGGPVTLTPVASQPGAPAYHARGSYASKAVDIALENGGFHQTQQLTLGIRLSEFAIAPMQDDTIVRRAGVSWSPGMLPDGAFEVFNVTFDGQGGADLQLRAIDRA